MKILFSIESEESPSQDFIILKQLILSCPVSLDDGKQFIELLNNWKPWNENDTVSYIYFIYMNL
jgi:hypothetical protein